MDNLKTSYEWVQELYFDIRDPDGWDRENFHYSWYEEKITKEEFFKRAMKSTVNNYSHRDN
jgi:hypothetical protein